MEKTSFLFRELGTALPASRGLTELRVPSVPRVCVPSCVCQAVCAKRTARVAVTV